MNPGEPVPFDPVLLPQRDRTLANHVPVFLNWLGSVRQRRENTVRSHGEDLKTFLAFCVQAALDQYLS